VEQLFVELAKNNGPAMTMLVIVILVYLKSQKTDKESASIGIEALRENTIAITRLETQMENVTKYLSRIERLESDVSEALFEVRSMKKKQRDS